VPPPAGMPDPRSPQTHSTAHCIPVMAMHAGSVVVAAAAGQCGKLGTGLAGLHGSQQAAVDGPSAAAKLAAAPRARQRKSREASVRPCRPNQASCGVPAAAAAAGRVWKKTVVTLVAVRMMMWRASTVTNADSAWRTLCRFDLVLSQVSLELDSLLANLLLELNDDGLARG